MTTLADLEISCLPPSVNHIWRACGRAVYKTKAAKDWQNTAIRLIDADRRRRGIFTPYGGKVTLRLQICTKTKRRLDIDNRVKAVQDCLAPAGVIKDDSQVWELYVRRDEAEKDYCRLTVRTAEE